MNTQGNEELITRWIDGDLRGEELAQMEALLLKQPELRMLKDASDEVGAHLRNAAPTMPHGDFFTSQLIRRIERDETDLTAEPVLEKRSWLSDVGKWLLPTAFAALTAGFVVGKFSSNESVQGAQLTQAVEVYTPDSAVSAELVSKSDSAPTVIILSGLEAIPDSVEIVAYSATADESSPRLAGLTL